MQFETLVRCWPELLGILLSLGCLRLLLGWNRVRLNWHELKRLHADQVGGVQTLSFVLTVPLFIFIMMFIVQLSQLTIAKVNVEYASFAAARAAVVWIPSTTELRFEGPNRISDRRLVDTETAASGDRYFLDDDRRLDVTDDSSWTRQRFWVYEIAPGSPKYDKIWLAAAMACVPISPSRDIELEAGSQIPSVSPEIASQAVERLYAAYAPSSQDNPRIPQRLRNKVAYALNNTSIELNVRHRDSELPLWFLRSPTQDGWYPNELGWQDMVTVEVTHEFALLPGPARLLARRADGRPGEGVEDSYAGGAAPTGIARLIRRRGDVYTYSITSSARLINQGHIPGRQYVQQLP